MCMRQPNPDFCFKSYWQSGLNMPSAMPLLRAWARLVLQNIALKFGDGGACCAQEASFTHQDTSSPQYKTCC